VAGACGDVENGGPMSELGVACANLSSGFAETDPGSFNNTVAEKQVSSLCHFVCVLPLCWQGS
jgi:hypothetical protein